MPSPALITGTGTCRANNSGAPDDGCRITIASAPSEVTVYPVSISDSPFSMLDADAEISAVVAPRDFAANSNETRVRVDDS